MTSFFTGDCDEQNNCARGQLSPLEALASLENMSCLVTNPNNNGCAGSPHGGIYFCNTGLERRSGKSASGRTRKGPAQIKTMPPEWELLLPDTVPLSGAGFGKHQHVGQVKGWFCWQIPGPRAEADGGLDWACIGLGLPSVSLHGPTFPCIGPQYS